MCVWCVQELLTPPRASVLVLTMVAQREETEADRVPAVSQATPSPSLNPRKLASGLRMCAFRNPPHARTHLGQFVDVLISGADAGDGAVAEVIPRDIRDIPRPYRGAEQIKEKMRGKAHDEWVVGVRTYVCAHGGICPRQVSAPAEAEQIKEQMRATRVISHVVGVWRRAHV